MEDAGDDSRGGVQSGMARSLAWGVRARVRSLEQETAAGVEHHGSEQQREINYGGAKQMARRLEGSVAGFFRHCRQAQAAVR